MQCQPVVANPAAQQVIPSLDRLLQAVRQLSPRQAAFFLLHFDSCFTRVTGRLPNDTERMIIVASLRRTVLENA